MDRLSQYVIKHSSCLMPRCEYVENGIEISCDMCQERMIQEHDAKVRADAIDDCKAVLKAHHMSRTCDDDFVPRVEIPFYRGLWKRFDELKEQK